MQIGVVTNNADGVFQRAIVAGVGRQLAAAGAALVLDDQRGRVPADVQLNWRALDGVLVIANCAPDEWIREVYAAGKPVTLVSHRVPALPVPSVQFNNEQGIGALVRHLVEDCQRRCPLFVRGYPGQIDAAEREAAYRTALLRANLDIDEAYFVDGQFEPDVAAGAVQSALMAGLGFDAVVASDYLMAAVVMQTLRAGGINVPSQVAVVGFGDAIEAAQAGVTTVAANVEALGASACRQLLAQVNGHPIRGVTTLSVELVVRASSGCAPA